MSVSLYRWTEECEQDPMCVGDCDLCRKETMEDKYNEIGIPEALERVDANKARPTSKCIYPKCEECDKYRGHYCTVPMVISKQIWAETAVRIVCLEKRLAELETLVTDEILGLTGQTKSDPNAELNYTWDDYLGESQ